MAAFLIFAGAMEVSAADKLNLPGIGERVSEIIKWINAPFVSRPVVGGVKDAVNNRVPHDKVRRSHINLGTEALFSILVLAFLHFLEKLQVFFYGTISPGLSFPGCSRSPRVLWISSLL